MKAKIIISTIRLNSIIEQVDFEGDRADFNDIYKRLKLKYMLHIAPDWAGVNSWDHAKDLKMTCEVTER